jgi:ABC-type transport system involved in cytochrome c biogenesis permease subunit
VAAPSDQDTPPTRTELRWSIVFAPIVLAGIVGLAIIVVLAIAAADGPSDTIGIARPSPLWALVVGVAIAEAVMIGGLRQLLSTFSRARRLGVRDDRRTH